jgi:DNA-binding response OmpR family regulator
MWRAGRSAKRKAREMLESTPILIVTPDETFAAFLHKAFSEYRYQVVLATDEKAGVEQGLRNPPSVILVDRRHLSIDGLRRQPQLRLIPIVAVQMLGADCAEDQCAAQLDQGLDACLCNQSHRELVARIRAIMRTNERLRSSSGIYTLGNLSMDIERHEVRVGVRCVDLAPREFEILKQFLRAPRVVFTRQELLDRVWGKGYAIEEHALDVHIHSLRRKIEPDASNPQFIITVRGVGYKLQRGD